MRLAYICHPFASDPEGNVNRVTELLRKYASDSVEVMVNRDLTSSYLGENKVGKGDYSDVIVPVCPLLVFPKFMSEGPGGIDREHALAFCIALLDACDELWVCSRTISDGMAIEISHASEHGMKIVWK